MLEALPLSQLLLRRMNVPKQLELFHHPLVLAYLYHHCCAMASLSEHQDSLGLTNTLDERRSLRPKLSDGLDILLKVNSSHRGSIAYSWEYFQTNRLPNPAASPANGFGISCGAKRIGCTRLLGGVHWSTAREKAAYLFLGKGIIIDTSC